jgi:hypothetical protein
MSPTPAPLRIAYFISQHGFGHAARACAVMEQAFAMEPRVEFEIFTGAPEWVFRDSLTGPFRYHADATDVGLVQDWAMHEDLAATEVAVRGLLEGWTARVNGLGDEIAAAGCRTAVADISPVGLAAGAAAGIPSVLVESFTWDQVYGYLADAAPALGAAGEEIRLRTPPPTLQIRTPPLVEPATLSAHATLETSGPVGRSPRTDPAMTRRALGVPESTPVVLVTLGGLGGPLPFLDQLSDHAYAYFVVPREEGWGFGPNYTFLPARSGYFHPDLVAASHTVVGKLGYSTLAETWLAGTRYAFLPREVFVETPSLVDFLTADERGVPITPKEFGDGSWLDRLPDLLSLPAPAPLPPEREDPAREAARAILELAAGHGA